MTETVLAPTGRIDIHTSASFLASMSEAIERGNGKLVLDFSGVSFLSSAGLRAIVVAAKAVAAKGGHMAIHSLDPSIAKVFEASGFSAFSCLSIQPDRAAAEAALA